MLDDLKRLGNCSKYVKQEERLLAHGSVRSIRQRQLIRTNKIPRSSGLTANYFFCVLHDLESDYELSENLLENKVPWQNKKPLLQNSLLTFYFLQKYSTKKLFHRMTLFSKIPTLLKGTFQQPRHLLESVRRFQTTVLIKNY